MAAPKGHTQSSSNILRATDVPPGKSGLPYVISTQEGEIIYIPLSKSATRLLVTGKESENAFAIVGSSGSQSDPIGFHYHREAHDVFLCLKGNVNVWAGEKCRTMGPGDFASVPPGTIHQYQILGNHSEMVGLIIPGGWEEFFRFIGEPYSGPLWPLDDQRNLFEVLIPKLKAAAEQFDMVPCPQHRQFGPSPWEEDENRLPGTLQPYFLKNGSGPAYLAGGMICRPLITTAESNGKFVIGTIEGSSHHHDSDLFANSRKLKFQSTHHAFQLVEGVVEFGLGSSPPAYLHAGELVYVPSGTEVSISIRSRYAKLYAFSSGKGIVELLCKIGEACSTPIPPEKAANLDLGNLGEHGTEFDFDIC
ncbi:hypothetical protein M409DRAFT_28769 [Zasmidium cellare ATCC 36951]|uniref:Cupin type-2 domain-containing protein n=1 Tax=Zasmidium cellare ATCC 36951 TaxID=1080233 RepID=A0A6A6C574_ZASCE|nr:uncharacterized protein M409DRAFT_28769 [Zasmidium cellare ATCC 36951]KAF2160889.1 hypothetical protein M409DRAFT_28769 [Zasmidium cellare ATCC 36951]